MIIKKDLTIEGMTCVNCENLIEKELRNTPGILKVEASFAKGNAEITYDSDKNEPAQIGNIIESLGYHVVKNQRVERNKLNITQILGAGILIFSFYMLLDNFGVLDKFNFFPEAEAGMGFGMLLIIGLLTSIHCVAMCGGINLSQCIPTNPMGRSDTCRRANLRPSLLYNLGRVISYTLIGGLVGAIGSVISFSGAAKGIVQMAAGVFMVIMGLNMLNVFPLVRHFNLSMPKILARRISGEKAKSNSPLYIGLLNGLMPCGPLQSMQIYALFRLWFSNNSSRHQTRKKSGSRAKTQKDSAMIQKPTTF